MNIYNPKPVTQNIEETFHPTRLYIKELAGIKYFGKTIKENIENYPGSGKIWKDRIKKYGKENIRTLWVSDYFYCPYYIQEFALMISELNQIVESKEWANYRPEDGLSGGNLKGINKGGRGNGGANKGKKYLNNKKHGPQSEEHKKNNATVRIGLKQSTKTRLKKSISMSGKYVGENNSNFDTMWITNNQESRRIKKTESIPAGWNKGRTI